MVVYYQALSTFKGTSDMFWEEEIYDIEEIEQNGFTVEELLNSNKIKLLDSKQND